MGRKVAEVPEVQAITIAPLRPSERAEDAFALGEQHPQRANHKNAVRPVRPLPAGEPARWPPSSHQHDQGQVLQQRGAELRRRRIAASAVVSFSHNAAAPSLGGWPTVPALAISKSFGVSMANQYPSMA